MSDNNKTHAGIPIRPMIESYPLYPGLRYSELDTIIAALRYFHRRIHDNSPNSEIPALIERLLEGKYTNDR